MRWNDSLLYGTHRLIADFCRAYQNARKSKPCCHAITGECKWCKAEEEEGVATKLALSPEARRIAAEREQIASEQTRKEIRETYNSIEEGTRDELRALAEEHMQRTGIPIHSENVERAVVNMFNRIMLKRLSE
jgi:hypothetical protein